MTETPKLSCLLVAHNEAAQIEACIRSLDGLADEIVVVCDRCTDQTVDIATNLGARCIEGAWPLEGDRRNTGIEACKGDWILEVDCDERPTDALKEEIKSMIKTAAPGYFLVPFDNYIGERRVRHGWGGSWGVQSAPRLFTKGAKVWGNQRVHPSLQLQGPKRRLTARMDHYVDTDISDMIRRLDRYTTAKAADMRSTGKLDSLPNNIRRFFSRFWKCYVSRKGYREGKWGFLIALMAALYPLLSYLKANLEHGDD